MNCFLKRDQFTKEYIMMPRLFDSPPQSKAPVDLADVIVGGEEELVVDTRSAIRPAQAVDQKLCDLLKGKGMMVSHMQLRSIISPRH